MKTMIFAAGLGTRLKPLTDSMPKALVEVDGKPLLQHLLEKLRCQGCREAVINVHHFADMIEQWCHVHPMGIDIRFSDEREELLETGGAIRHASSLLADGPFLIHNVDILSNADLARFYRQSAGAQAMLMVSERPSRRRLLFDDTMRLVGWTNLDTHEVKSPFPSLCVEACRSYAFSGIHVMNPHLFSYFSQWPRRFGIMDFYLSLCDREPIMGHVEEGLRLVDVGKLNTLQAASDFLCTL